MFEQALSTDPITRFELLIVDDQQAQLQSLLQVLHISGYTAVELAASGDEAIRKLQNKSFQLVLLDLQMPGTDGLNVLEFHQQAGLDSEVIVISGETTFSWVKEAMRLGAHEYIRKPYKPKDLLAVIEKALSQFQKKQKLRQEKNNISYLAYHDPLTSLPNRQLFNDRVNQILVHAQRSKQKFALLFMDMDRFKAINDSLGHLIGDRVLQQVATRILGCLRAEDTLSRFGGDEFALLLPDISDQHSVATVADKILNEVRKPFHVDAHELHLRISIGIAIYPSTGITRDNLLQKADIAMYHVKAHSKDNYCFYSETMDNGSAFMGVEKNLHQALKEKQFRVFFQPKVNPRTGTIAGLEALLRWHHPQRGVVFPGEFLAAAEESKLILALGSLVLHQVCEQLLCWQQQGFTDIPISLNISPVQIEQDNFVHQLIQVLKGFDLNPGLFDLEITEQSLLRGQKQVSSKIQTLRNHGVSVTVDDFGRGFLPLSYLQSVPVNRLKIDRSFVREIDGDNPHSARLVDGIAMMAKGMQLQLAADGVENPQQLEYLRRLGCEQVQGYLYSEALPAEEITLILQNRSTDGSHFAPKFLSRSKTWSKDVMNQH